MSSGGQRVVIAALVVNLAIAALKFVAAFASRSSVMLAEAGHSLADTANQVFLLIGMRRSARSPDARHPFGYGAETYFWSFIVALCIFAIGAGFSVHEGVEKIWHRHDPGHALGDPRWAFAILGGSLILEAISLRVALAEFRRVMAGRSLGRTVRESRDPTVTVVLFEDLAALFGLVVAFGGVFLSWVTGDVVWDGVASILVGVALAAVAVVLGADSKALLIGRGVTEAEERRIGEIVCAHPDVLELVHLRTMHFGPSEAIAAIKARFSPEMTTRALEARINELEARLREAVPQLRRIYVEPGFDEQALRREGSGGS